MKYTVTKAHIGLILTAMAALGGVSVSFGQSAPNAAISHSDTVNSLNGLNVGTLPVDIQTVVTNINGYLQTEQGINDGLVLARGNAQAVVDAQQAAIDAKAALIDSLISADPLDPQIAVEQTALTTLQNDLVVQTTALTNAQSAVTNSNINQRTECGDQFEH